MNSAALKLANPTSAVGQLTNNFDFTEFQGDLPEADNQRGWITKVVNLPWGKG